MDIIKKYVKTINDNKYISIIIYNRNTKVKNPIIVNNITYK